MRVILQNLPPTYEQYLKNSDLGLVNNSEYQLCFQHISELLKVEVEELFQQFDLEPVFVQLYDYQSDLKNIDNLASVILRQQGKFGGFIIVLSKFKNFREYLKNTLSAEDFNKLSSIANFDIFEI